ncbi:MAG TPA: ribosome maturation factor RimP [Candidatus Krumholzibacterium sp.]|nr:ribosome maturation factor RimP [Candidatus Krumholzibacterium sp.]
MEREENLVDIIEEQVALQGFELVKFDVASSGRKKVLRLYIDRLEGNVSIEDCVKVSRALGLVLEDDELIRGPFNLEVSSPGINRPLTKPEHYVRFTGRQARVESIGPDGKKTTVIGEIRTCDGSTLVIATAGREEEIKIDDIVKARLHGEEWEIGSKKGKKR